jgi:hypothetical protein
VISILAAASSPPAHHPPVWVDVLVYIVLLLLLVALLGATAIKVMMVFTARMNSSSFPTLRRVVTAQLVRLRPESIHPAEIAVDSSAVAAGIAAIQERDPLFDPEAVLAAARRVGFLSFLTRTGPGSGILTLMTTDEFWDSALGRQLANGTGLQFVAARAAEAGATRSATGSGGTATVAPAEIGRIYPLEFSVREARLLDVTPAVDGVDRITVRLGWAGTSALTGHYARAVSQQNHFDVHGGVLRQESKGWYDLELVRPVGEKTDPVVGGWRCDGCGGPYESEFDTECAFCGVARAVPEGEWMLNRGWLVACGPGA